MFYYQARYKFRLPQLSPANIPGNIILASAMPSGQLTRRNLKSFPHFRRRLFDPQLYLSGLDPDVAKRSVIKLSSYPWFGKHGVPVYDSDKHGSLTDWKELYGEKLLGAWAGHPPSDRKTILEGVRAAVRFQVELGCDAIILPVPLTTLAAQHFDHETSWIDSGIAICRELNVSIPIYATVAISDNLLRGADALQNPLLHTITNHLAARDELSGAYLVIEQPSEDGYVCTSHDTCLALLLMVDDLVRGAGRRVIVSYMGSFGAVAAAAGASIWTAGYYLSQRRLKLADFEETVKRAKPRFFSLELAGDIGLEEDLETAYKSTVGQSFLTRSTSSATLRAALERGRSSSIVPEWEFRTSNITAAAAHYIEVVNTLGLYLSALGPKHRREYVHKWLKSAVQLARKLGQLGISPSHYTELSHQQVWLRSYETWMRHAGV